MISPIFLNRNLSYMKNRMSRSHIKRKTFLVDSMLSKKMRCSEKANGYNWINDHLTMIFLGFYDKNLEKTPDNGVWVKVETILLKISHKKRKDSSSALMQATVGDSDVPLNPKENVTDKVPAISVPKESFKPLDDPLQLSVILLFRIKYYPSLTNGGDEGTEPLSKRPKLSSKLYGSELMIFDKQGRCQLTEGDYELNVQEISTQSLNKYNSPKKMSSWEHISSNNLDYYDVGDLADGDVEDLNPFAAFDRKPMLKFRLSWTKEAYCGLVDRPRAIVTDMERRLVAATANCNKENLPETNGHNNNVYGLLNGTAAAASKDANQTSDGRVTAFNGLQENGSEKVQLVYQFIYNNNSRQQTEPCQDLHCPWCSLNCNSLYSLLKHLKLCHARFNFNYVPLAKGSARIDVSINEIYDGSYTGSPHDLLLGAKSFSRTGPVQRTSVTNILVCRPRRGIKPSLSEFIELDEAEYEIQRPYITGHNRLYHHTETCLPVHPKELDIDSEGESDPLWLQQKTKQMIDEFTDVNEGEKELMKLWNLHVMKYGYVGDCQIPICISMFLECHGIELLQKNLYRNFVLHMCSLFDFGLISPAQMFAHCQQLASMDCPESRKIITEGREQQREHWRTVGVFKHEQQQLQKQKEQELKSRYRKESEVAKEGGDGKFGANGNWVCLCVETT
jgi:polycomb protein SUZ12